MKKFLGILAVLAVLAMGFAAHDVQGGDTYNVSIHGSHEFSSATDDTLVFASPISRFWFGTEQDVDLICLQSVGGSITYSMNAGDTWSPEGFSVRQIIIDATGTTTCDLYW